MTKTVNTINGSRGVIKVTITAAMVAALDDFDTAEQISLESVTAAMTQQQNASREMSEDFVLGDAEPIITPDIQYGPRRYQLDIFYTQGLEQLGTDQLDPYKMFKDIFEYNAAPFAVQFYWIVGTGASGQQTFTTSAAQTFIREISDPVPAGTREKVRFQVVFETTSIAVGTVA
jgi:hypothetical protein